MTQGWRNKFKNILIGTFGDRPANSTGDFKDCLYIVVGAGENKGKSYKGVDSGWTEIELQVHTHPQYLIALPIHGNEKHEPDFLSELPEHNNDFHSEDFLTVIPVHSWGKHSGKVARAPWGFSMPRALNFPLGADFWAGWCPLIQITGSAVKIDRLDIYAKAAPTESIQIAFKLDDELLGTVTLANGQTHGQLVVNPVVAVSDGAKLSVSFPDDCKSAAGVGAYASVYREASA